MSVHDWPKAVLRMGQLAWQRRELCLVTRDVSGGWRHRYREGVIVSPLPRHGSWRHHRRTTLDLACHEYTPTNGDVVVEVGAGWGTETVTLSDLVGETGRVYAVEASPRAAELLRRTIDENHLTNVTIIAAAITAESGTVTINERGGEGDIKNTLIATGEAGVDIPALTMDDLVMQYGIKRIDLLKVNIEGAERLLIRGMSSSAELVRHAMISCHDFVADKFGDDSFRTRAEVDAFLRDAGFDVRGRAPDPHRSWVRDHLYARRN